MRTWTPEQVARAAGARLVAPAPSTSGPERVVIDSREAGPGALFVGLRGESPDGGRFAPQALAAGAWGVLTTPEHAEAARCAVPGALLAAEDPLAALQRLATAWRRELDAKVIGVTGSTGKTSTKDLLLALLSPHRRTVASRANFNTEIGLPLEILSAPAGTEVLVLEMAMRGAGQIAELGAIAEPDVGVIVSVGPVHLELLGTIEAIAAAKAELIAALAPGGTAVVPAREPLLEPHLRRDVTTVTFGEGGDVRLRRSEDELVEIDLAGRTIVLEVPFTAGPPAPQPARRGGGRGGGRGAPAGGVALELSAGRGQHVDAARRRDVDRRLLQRQPDVDARRPRGPAQTAGRRPPPAPWRCSATCSSSGPASATTTSSSARRRSRRRRAARHGRPAGRRDGRAVRRRGPLGADAAAAAALVPGCCAPATSCWSRARAGSGSSWCAGR